MKPKFFKLITAIVIVAAINACSSSKSVNTAYKATLTQGTSSGIVEQTEKIFNRYSYFVLRSDITANQIRYESDWKIRLPFESETEKDIASVRNKLLIEARPKMRTEYGQSRVYTVRFTGITEYQLAGEDVWKEIPIKSKEATEYLQEIAYELKAELDKIFF